MISGQSEGRKGKSEKFIRRATPVDRLKQREEGDAIDVKFGFVRYAEVLVISFMSGIQHKLC